MATVDYLQLLPQSILNRDQSSNVGKLWRIFSNQVDLLIVEITKVYALDVIADQSGNNLDQIGKVIPKERGPGQSDADYRISLYAAISSKISSGSISDILQVIDIIKGGDSSKFARIIELYPAAFQIFTNMSELIADNFMILDEIRAAGVGLIVQFADTTNPFVFLNDPDGSGFDGLATELLELNDGENLLLDDGNLFSINFNTQLDDGGEFVEIIS